MNTPCQKGGQQEKRALQDFLAHTISGAWKTTWPNSARPKLFDVYRGITVTPPRQYRCVRRGRALPHSLPMGSGNTTYTLETICIVSTGAHYFDGAGRRFVRCWGQFRPAVPVPARHSVRMLIRANQSHWPADRFPSTGLKRYAPLAPVPSESKQRHHPALLTNREQLVYHTEAVG